MKFILPYICVICSSVTKIFFMDYIARFALWVGKSRCWCCGGRLTDTGLCLVVDSQCVAHGEAGRCDFYKCFEDRLPCGEQGYMIKYGQPYCARFERVYTAFSPQVCRHLTLPIMHTNIQHAQWHEKHLKTWTFFRHGNEFVTNLMKMVGCGFIARLRCLMYFVFEYDVCLQG